MQNKILDLAHAAEDRISLMFDGGTPHVAIHQFRSPFDARIDLPIPEERKELIQDSLLMQNAREILVLVRADLFG